MRALVRVVLLAVVRLFYRTVAVSHSERIPASGPCLLLANHPNGLLDPMVLRLALRRPVAFLAKSTFFKSWIGRLAMDAFDAIPVYRQKDGADTSQNEKTFELGRNLFDRKGWLAMFPEGVSHSDPSLKPLKTGAARLLLSAEARRDFALGVTVVPVGLLFDDKETFRSRVAVSVGEPLRLGHYAAAYAADERAAVDALTVELHDALAKVTLEADTSELWRGFVAVAAWTDPEAAHDLAAGEARARRLAEAYRRLRVDDPARADRVVEVTRRFVRTLDAIGVTDPLSLDENAPTAPLWTTLAVLLLAPLAAIGAVLGWLPYRLVRPLSRRISRGETDVVGTVKLLLGLLVMTVTYVGEAVAVGVPFGWTAGLATFALAPLTGFVALRFDERLQLRRDAFRGLWVRATDARVAQAVNDQRRELIRLVESALS